MYYIDHKILVLIIRASQLIRLICFPYSSASGNRGTAVLLLVSNIPVVLVHKILFSGPDMMANIGKMLFINFIGTEPKSLLKVVVIDFITIFLQAVILQIRWNPVAIRIISALPVPISDDFIPIAEDPSVTRAPSESPSPPPQQQNSRTHSVTDDNPSNNIIT